MRRVGLALVSAVLMVIGVLVVPAAAAAAPPAPPEPGEAAAAVTSPGGGFVGLPPATAFSGSIAAGATKRVTAQGVPGGAAAWLTLSVANPAAAGAVTVLTAAASVVPAAPNLVFVKGQTTSNSAVVPTSSAGALDLRNSSTRAIALRVDVAGYYQKGTPNSAGLFGPVVPRVVADAVTIPAKGSATVQAAGTGGIPATAAVVLATLAVAAPTGSGVLTAYPTGATRPTTQNLTFSAGRPQATLSAIRVSAAGKLTLFNNSDVPVTATLAVGGYFLSGNPTVAAAFQKVAPAVLFATTVAAHGAVKSSVTGRATVPSTGVSAVVIDLSAASSTAAGYLTAAADGASRPSVPLVPFTPGRASVNLVVVPVSASGSIRVDNVSGGPVGVRGEIVGYYLGASRLSWAKPRQINEVAPATFTAISCASTTFCMAADAGGFYFRFDGHSWSRLSDYGFVGLRYYENKVIRSISCVSANFCAAVTTYSSDVSPPSGTLSLWNGTTWTEQSIEGFGARGVSCSAATFCLATPDDLSVGWATWNGTRWSVADQSPSIVDLAAVSCASPSFCMALDFFPPVKAERFTAGKWAATAELTGATLLSCAGTTSCVATGGSGSYRCASGAWGPAIAAPELTALSCRTATFCVGVGAGTASVFNGSNWSGSVSLMASQPGTALVSCVSTSFCVAARGNQSVTFTGTAWGAPASIPNDPQAMARVSCAGTALCVGTDDYDAMAFSAQATADVGTSRLGITLDPPDFITDVSCASTTFCLATIDGSFAETFIYNGATWRSSGLDQQSGDFVILESLSCASSTFCAAVGTTTYLFGGTNWTQSADQSLTQVSCVSPTFCLATGPNGDTAPGISTVFNGVTWSQPVPVGDSRGGAPVSLSCRSATFCVGVDGKGRMLTFSGTSWSGPTTVAGADSLVAVSCATAGACVAVSSAGKAVQFTGSGWGSPITIDTIGRPTDVSCPSATVCVVVDDTGKAVVGTA